MKQYISTPHRLETIDLELSEYFKAIANKELNVKVHGDRVFKTNDEGKIVGEIVLPAIKLPGRNDPCNCGSGKKYKKCCGRNLL